MASPEVLELEKLTAPLPGENPAGASIRTDFSPTSIYFKAKDARTAARNAEKQMLFDDEENANAPRPDWRVVSRVCTEILTEHSKDLEVASWLVEAIVREEGFAGLRDGFRLLRLLCENFWDHLYPLPDEDGIVTRVAPISGLNGEESPGALITPINNIPITESGDVRPLTAADYRQAIDLDRVDPEKKARRIEQGAISLQVFERTVMQTSSGFFAQLLDDVNAAIDEFAALCALMDQRCGTDDDGMPAAPPSSYIRGALTEAKETIESVTRGRLQPAEGAISAEVDEDSPQQMSVVSAGAVTSFSANGNHVQTREAAFRELLRVAEYFRRNEPHSPVSYALEQAVRWGQMPLPELLNELISDESTRAGLFQRVGIHSPPDNS